MRVGQLTLAFLHDGYRQVMMATIVCIGAVRSVSFPLLHTEILVYRLRGGLDMKESFRDILGAMRARERRRNRLQR